MFAAIASFLFLLFAAPAVYPLFLEPTWSYADSIYFVSTLLTTVGYGNLIPSSDGSRAYTIAVILGGFVVFGRVLTIGVDAMLKRLIKSLVNRETAEKRAHEQSWRHGIAIGLVLMSIASGTIIFVAMNKMSFIESFYGAIVSATTIGLGDVDFAAGAPQRLLGVVYVLFATSSTAWAISVYVHTYTHYKHREMLEMHDMTPEEVKSADIDGDGRVEKAEFVLAQLRMIDEVDDELLDSILAEFEKKYSETPLSHTIEKSDNVEIDDDVPLLAMSNARNERSAPHNQPLTKLVHDFLEWRVIDLAIKAVICVAVVCFIVATIKTVYADNEVLFDAIEWFAVAFFSLEYIARVFSCVEMRKYQRFGGGLIDRLHFMISFSAIVDLLAILPSFVGLVLDSEDARFSVALRVLRLVRVLKVERQNQAVMVWMKTVKANATLFITAFSYALVALVVFSSLLYFTEREGPYAAYFYDVPNSMFMTMIMLTGEMPLDGTFTPAGKAVIVLIQIVAVAILAVPISLFASSINKAIQDVAKDGNECECPHCGERFDYL